MTIRFCFCRYFIMFASSSASDYIWLNDSSNCDAQLCTKETCQRRRNFGQLLQWLAVASKESDYLSQISNVVNTICTAPVSISLASPWFTIIITLFQFQQLLAPLALTPLIEFDEKKHRIDHVVQQYLAKASKSVQHLIPVETLSDGNCLFHSIVCLLPNSCVSAVELGGLLDSQHSFRCTSVTKCAFFSDSERWSNLSKTGSIIPLSIAIVSVLWTLMQFVERATTMNSRSCMKSQHWVALRSVRYTVFIPTLIIVPKWRS